jgi:hypothetical protein
MNPQKTRPKQRTPHKGKTKRRRTLQRRPVSAPPAPQPKSTVDRDLFDQFKPTEADAAAIGPASIQHWARFKWSATPLKRAPWAPGRLKVWLEVEATKSYGKLPRPEFRIFAAWWRWKRGMQRRVKRVHDGNVFYTDERGRIRVFWA